MQLSTAVRLQLPLLNNYYLVAEFVSIKKAATFPVNFLSKDAMAETSESVILFGVSSNRVQIISAWNAISSACCDVISVVIFAIQIA